MQWDIDIVSTFFNYRLATFIIETDYGVTSLFFFFVFFFSGVLNHRLATFIIETDYGVNVYF